MRRFEGVIEQDSEGNGSYYKWNFLRTDNGESLKLLEMTEGLEYQRVRITIEEVK